MYTTTTTGTLTDKAFADRAHSNGAYNGNAYRATITPLYRYDDIELRSVEHNGVKKYEVLFDDEVYQKFPTLKAAQVYFSDFSGLTPGKMEKKAKVA